MTKPREQRWVKPSVYDVAPGHWKKQLPGKHLAVAARGRLPELEALLSANPEYLNRRGNHGRTLLWEACRKGRLEAVEYLLGQGADPRLTGCYNSESHVQLDCFCAARFYQQTDVAARLAKERLKPDIFRASFLGDLARVDALLQRQPHLINAEDPCDEIYRVPPVAFALAGGQAETLRHLVERGALVDPYSSLLIFLIGLLDRPEYLDPLVEAGLDLRATDASTFVASQSLFLFGGPGPARRAGQSGGPQWPPCLGRPLPARKAQVSGQDRIADRRRRGCQRGRTQRCDRFAPCPPAAGTRIW